MLDLHFHSTSSDGFRTPAEILSLSEAGNILTCTDHDFVNEEFTTLAGEKGVRSCQSVEISAYDPETPDRTQLHITYYANQVNNILLQELATLRRHKEQLVVSKLEKLKRNGFMIDIQEFYTQCEKDGFTNSRLNGSHVARYVFSKPENIKKLHKIFGSPISATSFIDTCLKSTGSHKHIGTPDADMTAITNMDIRRVIHHAKRDSAVASLAHPNFSLKTVEKYRKLLPKYLALGLTSVEINTAATQEWVDEIMSSQRQLEHSLTFGSDCHFKPETDNKHSELGGLNPLLEESFMQQETLKTLQGKI